MPGNRYYKKYSYRRKGYKKPNQYQKNTGTSALIPRNWGSAWTVAQRALAIATGLKGLINSEKKYHDKTTTALVSFSGTVEGLSHIAQGDDVGNRDGNSILARSLWVQLDVKGNTAQTSTVTRVVIFIDTENTGTTPTASDLLQVTGSQASVDSPLNVDHTSRYVILLDKKFTNSLNGQMRLTFKKYIKLYKHIKYTGSSATDTYKNNIYILYISDVNTDDPQITYYSRLGFMDN